MFLRIRKYTRQCQESHTNVFNQLILSFIRCKFMAYFREINHDISLINLKISVEKEGKNICFHWSELRMKCQRRKKTYTNLRWRDKWTIVLCFELVRKTIFFLFLRCNNYWKWLKLLTTCRLIYICAAALFLFFIWTTNVKFVCGRDWHFLFYSCQREKFISVLFKYTLHEVYLFINGGKVYVHSFFFFFS